LKIAVCDDEKQDLCLICSLIGRYDSSLDLTTFSRAKELLDAYQNTFYDLVFLDIEMEEPNGFDVAKTLMERPEKPLIVFVTNSSEYTLRGYGVAFRYLKKPVQFEEIKKVLSLAMEQIVPQRITLVQREKTLLLSICDILYIEVKNHNILVQTKSGQYELRGKLKDMEAQLPSVYFAKPHNSYVVNLAEVSSIATNSLQLTNGDTLPISQRNRKAFELALFQYVRR
jgi:DNA-binding LytR/AlgR family response regulator